MASSESSSSINIKMSAVIVGVSMLLLSLLFWSLSTQYENVMDQIKIQWQQTDNIEKVICAEHPERCPDL